MITNNTTRRHFLCQALNKKNHSNVIMNDYEDIELFILIERL